MPFTWTLDFFQTDPAPAATPSERQMLQQNEEVKISSVAIGAITASAVALALVIVCVACFIYRNRDVTSDMSLAGETINPAVQATTAETITNPLWTLHGADDTDDPFVSDFEETDSINVLGGGLGNTPVF